MMQPSWFGVRLRNFLYIYIYVTDNFLVQPRNHNCLFQHQLRQLNGFIPALISDLGRPPPNSGGSMGRSMYLTRMPFKGLDQPTVSRIIPKQIFTTNCFDSVALLLLLLLIDFSLPPSRVVMQLHVQLRQNSVPVAIMSSLFYMFFMSSSMHRFVNLCVVDQLHSFMCCQRSLVRFKLLAVHKVDHCSARWQGFQEQNYGAKTDHATVKSLIKRLTKHRNTKPSI